MSIMRNTQTSADMLRQLKEVRARMCIRTSVTRQMKTERRFSTASMSMMIHVDLKRHLREVRVRMSVRSVQHRMIRQTLLTVAERHQRPMQRVWN